MKSTLRGDRKHHEKRVVASRQSRRPWISVKHAKNTATPCSCDMCGNPRRHFNDVTMAERRADCDDISDIVSDHEGLMNEYYANAYDDNGCGIDHETKLEYRTGPGRGTVSWRMPDNRLKDVPIPDEIPTQHCMTCDDRWSSGADSDALCARLAEIHGLPEGPEYAAMQARWLRG